MPANPDYAHWLYCVGELNEPNLPWKVPTTLNPDCFSPLLRALYLAGYGPGEARNFVDQMAHPEQEKVVFNAKKKTQDLRDRYSGLSTEVDLSSQREL